MSLWAEGFWADGFWADNFWEGQSTAPVDLGVSITNSNASVDDTARNNVCMRTGFKVKPYSLIKDAYGALVRPESYDRRHPQELIRPLAEELTGPTRPEGSDLFISTSIAPEDL